MQTFKPNPVGLCSYLQTNVKKTLVLYIGLFMLSFGTAFSQGNTCATATAITASNAASCTPGTTFNTNGSGTGASFSTCTNAGGYNWGSFTAYSSTASITYTPSSRNAMIFAYSGSCASLTQIGCADVNGNGGTETLNLTGLNAGTTYYFVIARFNNSGSMNGNVCVASPYSIVTGTISGSPFCAGSTVSVPFTSYGTYSSNTYTAQLSDAAGSFASPTSIGTLTSTANTGTITATIPTGTASGSGYRIRVISSGPSVTGADNGTNITINALPQGSLSGNTICGSGTPTLTFTATAGTGPFQVIYNDGILNRTKNGAVSGTPFTLGIPPVVTTNYSIVTVTDNNGCTRVSGFTGANATITISSTPTIVASTAATTICYSSGSQSSGLSYSATTGSPTQYSITWDATALSAGLVNVTNASITSSPLNIPVAANVAASTYNGTLTVTNASGCVSSGSSFTLTINSQPTVTGTLSACVGATTQLTGSGTPASSNPWVSATTSVATVNSTGLVTGVSGGTSVITYTNNNGCSRTATVTINALPTITGTLTPCIGTTTQLTGSGTPASSNPWVSATTSVATVNSTGLVTGVSIGTSIITYTNNNGCSNTATVTVGTAPTITGTLTACVSATTQLTGSGTPAASNPWVSATTSVATVNSTGLVTGVSGGTSVITYTNSNGCTVTATVTINALPTITGTLSACVGATTQLTGSGTPAASNPWVSATTSVATVSSTGLVTGVSAGTSVITYTNSIGCSRTATVTINAIPSITGTLNTCIGSTTQLTGSGTPAASSPWVSATTSVATVNSTGLVTGVSAGTSIITYTTNAGCSNTATVTVNSNPTITGTLSACAGATTQLTGSGSPAASNPWVSATTSVATVNSTGLVTGVSAGTSVITYTNINGCTATATVTINSSPVAPVITPASATVCNNTIQSLSVSNYANNSPQTTSSGSISISIPDNSSAGASSTISISSIPSTATVTGISVNFNITHTFDGDLILNLKAPNGNVLNLVNRRGGSGDNFTNTTISSSSSTAVSGGSAPFTGTYSADAASGVGPTSNVSNVTTFSSLYGTANGNWIFSARDNAGSDVGTITSWSITITYTVPSITWTTNTTQLYTDAAATIPYVAQTTATVYAKPSTTQTYTATTSPSGGCTSSTSVTVTVTTPPTITTSSAATTICYSTGSQTSNLTYSATTGSPTTYTITWDAAGLSAGLANVGSTALPASPITVPVAAGVTAGTYTGTITVSNAGCGGTGTTFTLTVNPPPTITASASAITKCASSSYQNGVLAYSATTNSPTTYSVTWDAAGLSAGLTNVSNATLSASYVVFPIPGGTTDGSFTGTLVVTNAAGCSSTGTTFTQTIGALPTITTSAAAATKCFSSSAQTSTLAYSATTGSPTLYNITWDAAALSAGLVNTGNLTIPASQLNIPIAAGVASGTYNGSVRVINGAGCQSVSGVAFTVTISSASAPTMTSSSTASVCSGGTVNLVLTANVASTFTWIAADNSNITGESLTLQTTSTLSNTLVNSLTTAQAVTYTVTPTASGGCQGAAQTVTVTVNPLPTITASSTAASRCYNTTAQTSTLSYSATTGSPSTYSITWNAAALSAGLTNTGSVALPGSPITFTIPAGVAVGTYTGSLTVATAAGCTSSASSFTVSITSPPSITSQPSDVSVCSGSSASFTVAASGTGLTYQWRKGTTNLCNCTPGISGATTATLTINPVATGNAATNYNCVVSSSGCSSSISDYATLTVTTSNSAPTTPAKDLVFPTVSTTSILASYTASSDATHYLVIRKTTNVTPTTPSDGTTYTLNTSALGGTVAYVGTSISFTSNGLNPGTTYYFWVYPYNVSSCGTSPMYFTSSPLTGEATTATNVACGTVTTLYWGGAGSSLTGRTSGTDFNTASNWSTSNSSYVASPAAPSECNDVSLALTSAANINLSSSISVYNLTFTLSANNTTAKLSVQGNTLTVNGNAVIDVLSGNTNTNIYIGETSSGAGVVDFKANFRIGETYFASSVPKSYLVGNVNSKITFRGDVLFGRTAAFILPGQTSANAGYPPSTITAPGTGTTPGTIEFDGNGLQQVLWNNNVWYDCFYNIVVGNQNKPYVKHVTGTYTPDNILNNFTISDGSTVDLGTSQWIREMSGGTFTMGASSKLILGNNQSIQSNCGTGCHTGVTITGSNFPGGFSTLDISSASTIEYNGGSSITQTVYATPTYGSLVLSNGDGTGTANKISTGTITVSGASSVGDKTKFTPGTGVVVDGSMDVNSGATWVCGTNTVTGGGSFNLNSGGTLNIGSAAGITLSGSSGNIQSGSRSFSTGGNYTYNGSTAQATGDGLPTTMNNLTISNTAGVTMYAGSQNYTVSGTLALTSGALAINGNTLNINNLTRSSGTLTGSATSSVGVTGSNVPLFFTSGGRTLKNLSLGTGASADLQTTLDITAGSSAGSVSVGSSATLNTYGNLTLKSDANGTARVAEIPVNGSGVALGNINGDVVIERYIPAKRSWRLVTAPVQASGSQTINTAWQEGAVNTDLSNNQNPNPGFGVHISGSSPSLGFDATPLNNPSLKVFNRSTSNWDGIGNTLSTYVRDYEGYMLFVRGNRSTNLSLNNYAGTTNTVIRETDGIRMGRQSVTLPSSAGSYSVVGNPYPSTIDFRTLSITGLGSAKTFIMWDPALTGTAGVGAYQYFTQTGGPGSDYAVFPGGGSYGVAGTVNNYVQSGQAFLVQNSGAATLTINESSKVSPSTSTVFRLMPDNITGRISTILYGVEADSSTTVLDGGLMLYRSEFSDDLDLDDAKKLSNLSSENFGINKGSAIYQIEKKQTINATDTIQYSMRNLKARTYQLEVELKNMEVTGMTAFLKDNYTGTVTPLDYNNVYKLRFTPTNAAAGSYAPNRFLIYFREMTVLPVTFTSLQAYRKEDKIAVEWKVENESNIHHYEVERSADGINFSKIGSNTAATNSTAYTVTDDQPLNGLNYFRVKAVSNNRRAQFTNIAKVFFGKNGSGITVFPNPVTDGKINLYINGEQTGDYTINLFSSNGQLIKTNKLTQVNGNGNTTVEMDKGLSHGTYILEVIKPDLSKEHINVIY